MLGPDGFSDVICVSPSILCVFPEVLNLTPPEDGHGTAVLQTPAMLCSKTYRLLLAAIHVGRCLALSSEQASYVRQTCTAVTRVTNSRHAELHCCHVSW